MTDLEPFLQRLGLQLYYDAFVAEGFETWETVLDIQESDLETLNVRLGHRRKLQRAIAEYRGFASDRALGSPSQDSATFDVAKVEPASQQLANSKETSAANPDQKRKYRRHPKPDEHAPEKPPSAYVLFSNRIREEVKADNLSFTEIARLVGERWQKLEPSQKEQFESHAATLKETYLLQLADYKKTDSYKEYNQYLADFKVKHGNQNESKRPKLEQQTSSSLSAASGGELSTFSDSTSQVYNHGRGDSVGSASTASLLGNAANLQLVTSLPTLNAPVGRRESPQAVFHSERRAQGQASGHSSLSEESSGVRSEQTDTVSRTANLSIGTPPVGTSPSTLNRAIRPEYGQGYQTQQWSTRQPIFSYPPSATSGASPGSATLSLPSSATFSEGWRERQGNPHESRTSYANAAHHPSSSMQISQLVGGEAGTAPSQRILPPLRQMSGTPTSLPYPPLSAPKIQNQPINSLSPPEIMAFRHSTGRIPANPLDSEAADTLARLADRRESGNHPKTPRSYHEHN